MHTEHKLNLGSSASVSGNLPADVRTSMTSHFLKGASLQALSAAEIEARPVGEIPESDQAMHRSLVIGAIMQATAALECEIWEVMVYGPGHHLGSNGIDTDALAFLAPIADQIDGKSVLERYRTVLDLLRKAPLRSGEQPWQDAALVVKLRNELVHYKPRWGHDLEQSRLLRALPAKTGHKPPFVPEGTNYFPYRCLSAWLRLVGGTVLLRLARCLLRQPRFSDEARRASPILSSRTWQGRPTSGCSRRRAVTC